MRRAPLVAAALFATAAAFAADPAAKPFKASFYGEGGGSSASNPATDQYLLGNQGQAPNPASPSPAPAPSVPAAPKAPAPAAPVSPAPVAAAPAVPPDSSAAPRAVAAVPAPSRSNSAAPARGAAAAVEPTPAGGRSLWNGQVQPLAMTGAAAAESTDPDAARAGADRDYETRVLGVKSGPERAPLTPPSAPGRAGSDDFAAPGAPGVSNGKLFVSLSLDTREAGSLRDAVAGLGSATGFSADARFEAAPGRDGMVLLSGWIPAGRLGDAMKRPGVKSLRIETRAQPSNPRETSGEFLIGLRVDDASRAREGVDAGVGALASAAGFRLTRVVGLETAPDGRSVAVVTGVLPLSRLPRAMGLAQVAKIVPIGGEVPGPSSSSLAPGAAGVSGFARFALQRGAWLIVLTLLLLLPSLRAPVSRLAAVFNPYR